jgi:uncharacterized protein (TIGR02270 family)
MTAATLIPEIVERHCEDAASLWISRDALYQSSTLRLPALAKLDERVEANVDALRIAQSSGWSAPAQGFKGAGEFFATGIIVVESRDLGRFDQIIEFGNAESAKRADEPYDPVSDPWRGLVSALGWAEQSAVLGLIQRLLDAPKPRARWLGVAAAGARRIVGQPGLVEVFLDPHPLVRAQAYRTAGQLGRADLVAQVRPGLADDDPECRFWSAWAAARMGARGEALDVLADIAWNNQPRAVRALDLLLRRLDVPQANAWLREFAKLPGRQRDLIRAAGVIGDPLYVPWLIERMAALETTRLAGEAFSMITGLDLAYRDLDRKPPQNFESGPNDDPADENVSLDDDEHLPWPDPEKIGQWWTANRGRFNVGTPYFLGAPKPAADLLQALSDAFQRQRHAAALELAIRQPDKAMFEVRARGRLQRQLLAGASGKFGR